MKFSVNYRDLTDEQKASAQRIPKLVRGVKDAVRKVSFGVERVIKSGPSKGMPIDLGRAVSSWGHWTPGLLRSKEGADAAGMAVWEVKDDGFTIEQGSNLEYIDYLNDGTSQQSPAGFLDMAEERGSKALEDEIDRVIDRYM